MSIKRLLLHQYLTEAVENNPDKPAVIYQNKQYSYAEINKLVNNLVAAFIHFDIQRGDRIIVKLGNSVEAIIAFWAILRSDAIVSIIGEDINDENLLYILRDSGASLLITNSVTQKCLQQMAQVCANLKNILINCSDNFDNAIKKINVLSLPDYLYNHSLSYNFCVKNISLDIASIIYTSGSTGEPKGVVLTHRNMLVAASSINAYLENNEDEVIICVLPISFDYGLYQMIMSFSLGATLVLEKDFVWPHLFLKSIVKNNVTAVPCVPSMVILLNELTKRIDFDLSTVRYVTNTGAALLPKHIEALKSFFPAAKIYSMYGLTECKRCTYLPPQEIDKKPGSVGIAIPNTELWIVDEDDHKLGPNKIGQLVIRGETVMKEYWNKPEETAQKIKENPLSGERLLYTGDYCWQDEDGYLYFHGRMDEILKCRGIKVSPKEVEDFLMTLDGVKEAAVIGVEDIELSTAIHAFITSSQATSEEEIMRACRSLSAEKRPKFISILKNMPKTTNGKIDKRALKEIGDNR